jgi:hypothetical protein
VGGAGLLYVFPRRRERLLTYWVETCSKLVPGVWTNSGYRELPVAGMIDADFEAVTNEIPTVQEETFIRLWVQAD